MEDASGLRGGELMGGVFGFGADDDVGGGEDEDCVGCHVGCLGEGGVPLLGDGLGHGETMVVRLGSWVRILGSLLCLLCCCFVGGRYGAMSNDERADSR
jgi:hypothetical protein